jgi:ankyrin repeat protein
MAHPSDLRDLLEISDVKRLYDAIAAGCDVNWELPLHGSVVTALCIAANVNNAPMIRALLESGALVNKQDSQGWSPLMWASYRGHEAAVEALVNGGAEATLSIAAYASALGMAVGNDHACVIKHLVKAGADVNIADNADITFLEESLYYATTDTLAALLDAGAHVNMPSRSGWSPLMHAASFGLLEFVEVLLDAGADVHWHGTINSFNPLMLALFERSTRTAKRLLEAGADIRGARNRVVGHPEDEQTYSCVTLLLAAGLSPYDIISPGE